MSRIDAVAVGSRFGAWVVLERLPRAGHGSKFCRCRCRCDCGTEATVSAYHMLDGKSLRCRACGYRSVRAVDERAMVGRRFNHWTVIGEREAIRGVGHYLCRCDCGTELKIDQSALLRGRATHCLACKNVSLRKYEVSTKSVEYQTWRSMIDRCTNPNATQYENYGGRGIAVCAEWLARGAGFRAFLAHIGRRPGRGYSIDRIDNDRGYEPGNVRWATNTEQLRNTRVNRRVEMGGVTRCVSEWAEVYGVNAGLVFQRLDRGWDIRRALTTPVDERKHHRAKRAA